MICYCAFRSLFFDFVPLTLFSSFSLSLLSLSALFFSSSCSGQQAADMKLREQAEHLETLRADMAAAMQEREGKEQQLIQEAQAKEEAILKQ